MLSTILLTDGQQKHRRPALRQSSMLYRSILSTVLALACITTQVPTAGSLQPTDKRDKVGLYKLYASFDSVPKWHDIASWGELGSLVLKRISSCLQDRNVCNVHVFVNYERMHSYITMNTVNVHVHTYACAVYSIPASSTYMNALAGRMK